MGLDLILRGSFKTLEFEGITERGVFQLSPFCMRVE